jgi:hypothetical protein
MGTKTKLYVGLIAVMLLSLVALPVLAEEDPIAVWVSGVRLAWNGRSSSGTDRVVGMVHVRDANMAAVEDAVVTAEWTLPDGTVVEETATTAFQGIATFETWLGRGEYQLCATDVVKDGWAYDAELSLEPCAVLVVKWPFNPAG